MIQKVYSLNHMY